MKTQSSFRSVSFGIAAVLLFGLCSLFSAAIVLLYQESLRSANIILERDARIAAESIRERFSQNEILLTELSKVFPEGAGAGKTARQAVRIAFQKLPELSAVIFRAESVSVLWNPQKRKTEEFRDIPGLRESLPSERDRISYSDAVKTSHGKFYFVTNAEGTVSLVETYEDLLKSILEASQITQYESALLSPVGERLASSGFMDAQSNIRVRVPVDGGDGKFILELVHASFHFWTPMMVLIAVGGGFTCAGLIIWIFVLFLNYRRIGREEKNLRQSEERFRILWEKSTDPMRLTDRYGRIVAVNTAYSDLVKISHDKLLEEYRSGNIDPSHREANETYREQFDAGTLRAPASQIIHRPRGEDVPVEASHSFIHVSEKEKLLLSVFHDVRERKRMEEELQQVQKMDALGALATGIGNDFNNIVGMIMNAAEMIHQRMPLDGETMKYMEIITNTCKRGGELASELLVFARNENQEEQAFSVARHLDQLKNVLEHSLSSSMNIAVDAREKNVWVMGDVHQFHQAIVNLALTVQDRMPKGGTITLKSAVIDLQTMKKKFPRAEENDYVAVSLLDSGRPLTDIERRRIFEPFFTVKAATKGTGLRLAAVYGIMKRHRGFIAVTNRPETGAEFALYFPIHHLAETSEDVTPTLDEMRGNGELILVVDDEEVFRQLFTAQLENYGYRTITASDGEEALAIFKGHPEPINLVLSDLSMPKMNGEELYRELRMLTPDLKVIFSTGNIDHKSKNEILQMGVRGVIDKPFTLDKLLQLIHQVIKK
jgi:PAS domain S-box-containing protein